MAHNQNIAVSHYLTGHFDSGSDFALCSLAAFSPVLLAVPNAPALQLIVMENHQTVARAREERILCMNTIGIIQGGEKCWKY